ncbi:MAG: hypothetical protein ACO3PY_05030 [Pontimonas sp.]|jgi:hypothetical protein
MTVQICLEPWEYEHASNVGIRRFTANWGKKDAQHYKAERMEDNRTAEVAAAICELAVAKHENRYWHAHIWHRSEHNKYRDLPDVGTNIEVRRIRTRKEAAVRRHQLGKNLVLYVAEAIAPEFMEVTLYGYLEYDQAWEQGTASHYDPENTRVISVHDLKPPTDKQRAAK